jgi:hypothetical protein
MSESTTHAEPEPGGVIRNVAVLDLTANTRPEELAHIRRIEDVAVVLVRESAASALTRIDLVDVASVVQIPEHGMARVHTGTVTLSGESFADESAKDDVLVVTGTLVATTPVRRVVLAGIIVTGIVLAPEGSDALGTALTRLTGSFTTFPYREGQHIEQRAGNVEVHGATLANRHGTPDDVLLVSGILTVEGEVGEVGYGRIVVAGALIAPRAARDVLEPRLNVPAAVWYTGRPIVFTGPQTIGRTFFQLVEEPATLVFAGPVRIDADVSLDDVRAKVAAVYTLGPLEAPKDVLALFQIRGELLGPVKATEA